MSFLFHTWFSLFLFPFVMGRNSTSYKTAPNAAPHPFYVAVTEVAQNTAEKSLEISCKFFVDDFEQTLENNYKTQLDIAAAKDKASFDKYIPDYINKHLILTADGKPLKLNYVGYEKEKE